MRAPRQGLSPSRRENRRPLGARDASQACAGVAAGRAYSIQAIEAMCCLWTHGSTGIEPGTLRPSTTLVLPTTTLCVGGRAEFLAMDARSSWRSLNHAAGASSTAEPTGWQKANPAGCGSSSGVRRRSGILLANISKRASTSSMQHSRDLLADLADLGHLTLRFTADVFPRFSSISYSTC